MDIQYWKPPFTIELSLYNQLHTGTFSWLSYVWNHCFHVDTLSALHPSGQWEGRELKWQNLVFACVLCVSVSFVLPTCHMYCLSVLSMPHTNTFMALIPAAYTHEQIFWSVNALRTGFTPADLWWEAQCCIFRTQEMVSLYILHLWGTVQLVSLINTCSSHTNRVLQGWHQNPED